MVPSGWKLTSLGEVCSGKLQTGPFGSQLHAHEYTDEGVPVLMPKDLINFRVNNELAAKIPVHRANDLKKHILKSGDLLFSRRGDVARFALIESDYPRMLCGTGCLKATPNQAHSPLFLSYFLQKDAVKKWLEQNAVGQTMPNMNTAILAELPLMAASSKEEEDKIAKILSTWDNAIRTTEKLIETSKQQKKALMQQLLTGKKRLINPETGKAFDGEWEEALLATWLIEYKEKSSVQDQHRVFTSSRTGLVPQTEYFGNSRIVDRNNIGFHVLPPNHMTYRSRSDDGFFTFNLFKECDNGIISHYYPIFTTKGENEFFIALFEQYRGVFGKYSVGTSQKVLSFNALKGIKFKIPNVNEQQKIASVLTAADKEIEALETKLAHFKQEKKALMQQLLTGKRRVSVPLDG
ncbi:restriction endonuclease subunit S [Shewanella sp. 202IG2-18]|uniref:restriction endonuclease subunit S n=1 Tax=Parashewanella hymeniacidonis TaxID=2807618 RepID=UPI001961A0C0|nr:restriction endonuclease subunit S [Parashewanella hymeniacidonis]MBM7072434.1 restriction endonuclease subunit S [Parashewanella hymeniacidonis]